MLIPSGIQTAQQKQRVLGVFVGTVKDGGVGTGTAQRRPASTDHELLDGMRKELDMQRCGAAAADAAAAAATASLCVLLPW